METMHPGAEVVISGATGTWPIYGATGKVLILKSRPGLTWVARCWWLTQEIRLVGSRYGPRLVPLRTEVWGFS
jgi:hypothetical protein